MAFVVGTSGIIAMNASEYFENHIADKLGLRPVFKMKRKWFQAHRKFTHTDDGCVIIEHVEPEVEMEYPSEEEVDNYIRKREEYVADAILKYCGWDAFIKRCKLCNIEDTYGCECEYETNYDWLHINIDKVVAFSFLK